jgi:benzoate/toluate 1,2-dioxygenase beta subunit
MSEPLINLTRDTDPLPAPPPLQPAKLTIEEQRAVEQFLYYEARLLDENLWDEWLRLFTSDGTYWAPLTRNQPDPFNHVSLFWEDALLREVRVRRLKNLRNWSQQPPSYSAHVIGNVMIDGRNDAGDLVVHSTFHMVEWRKEDQRLFAGTYQHLLARQDEHYLIRQKKVRLVNCEAVHENLQVFI